MKFKREKEVKLKNKWHKVPQNYKKKLSNFMLWLSWLSLCVWVVIIASTSTSTIITTNIAGSGTTTTGANNQKESLSLKWNILTIFFYIPVAFLSLFSLFFLSSQFSRLLSGGCLRLFGDDGEVFFVWVWFWRSSNTKYRPA